MARDLELLENLREEMILRLYQWQDDWVSYGYFQTEEEAHAQFPDPSLSFVKRPTGGGLVDHRQDITYTLLIPRQHPWFALSRADCYQRIHEVIQKALADDGYSSHLVVEEQGTSKACFDHPVPGDLIDPRTTRKLAGAAQRRTRKGLLHQGSIALPGLSAACLVDAFVEEAGVES